MAEAPAVTPGARSIQETPEGPGDMGVASGTTTPGMSGTTIPSGAVTVEILVELWPRIRLDVKAKNRRIEALLSSIDPVAVDGSQVTLVAAYDFHRNRINSDEVRGIVEDVISALVRQRVQVTCVMRGEMVVPAMAPASASRPVLDADPVPGERQAGPAPATTPDRGENPSPPGPSGPGEMGDADAVAMAAPESPWPDEASLAEDERRIAAIKNVFDAEEIPNEIA